MAIRTPNRPEEEEFHGEKQPKPVFGSDYDENAPLGNPADPRSNDTAAGDPSDPRGDGPDKVGGLDQARKNPAKAYAGKAAQEEQKAINNVAGRGYKTGDKFMPPMARLAGAISGLFKTKKGRAGIAGGSIVGVVVMLFSIVQGPLAFIHLAQVLQTNHFLSQYEATDGRFGKMTRYIYHRSNGQTQKTNLGYLQNKYADKIDGKLRAIGVVSEYNQRFGYKERSRIDGRLFGDRNMSLREIEAKIQRERPGINTYREGGKVYVSHSEMKDGKNRAFERYIQRKAGYSRVMAALNGRVMARRAGYVLHPFKKLDKKALQKLDQSYERWREQREKKIKKGRYPSFVFRSGESSDTEDGKERDKTAKDTAGTANNELEKIRNSKTFRYGALGPTAVAAVACMLRSIDANYDNVKQVQVILPLIRLAMDIISVGAQIQSGDDFDIAQLGFMNKILHTTDENGKESSFNQAKSLLGEEGKKGGVKENKTLKTIGSGSPFAPLNKGKPNSILSPICSTPGQIAQLSISFFAAPVSAVVGGLAGVLAGPIIEDEIVKHLSGNPVNPLVAGADYGNAVNYGARLAANSQASSNGGQPLSKNQERQLAAANEELNRREFESKSFFARMFDIYDHRSLASSLTGKIKPGFAQNFSGLFSTVTNIKSSLASTFASFLPSASARDPNLYDYGFSEVGFSLEELNSGAVESPFKNSDDVVSRILPNNRDYIDRAEKCFGVKIDENTYDVTPMLDKYPTLKDINSSECKDNSRSWMKVRFYIFDNNVALSVACYEGDESEQACAKLGAGDSPGGSSTETPASATAGASIDLANLTKPSVSIACAANTKDAGVIDGYTGGNKVRIRLCEIPNLPQLSGYGSKNGHATVNSRVSGAVYAMVAAAKKDNVNMSAVSSSRTMADQQSLCPCDGVTVARPGYSNHQLGVAIDFGGNGQLMDSNNPMWKWLDKNAARFDYKPYEVEPWHWSPLGN